MMLDQSTYILVFGYNNFYFSRQPDTGQNEPFLVLDILQTHENRIRSVILLWNVEMHASVKGRVGEGGNQMREMKKSYFHVKLDKPRYLKTCSIWKKKMQFFQVSVHHQRMQSEFENILCAFQCNIKAQKNNTGNANIEKKFFHPGLN